LSLLRSRAHADSRTDLTAGSGLTSRAAGAVKVDSVRTQPRVEADLCRAAADTAVAAVAARSPLAAVEIDLAVLGFGAVATLATGASLAAGAALRDQAQVVDAVRDQGEGGGGGTGIAILAVPTGAAGCGIGERFPLGALEPGFSSG